MRIVFYTHSAFLAPALHFTRVMSRVCEFHVLLEVSPGAWQTALFDMEPTMLPPGIVPADPVLRGSFPDGARAYWSRAASFNLVVHPSRKSIHPTSLRISHRVTELVRRVHPDVVHFDAVPRRLLLNLPELARSPLVLSVHDPELHAGEHNWRSELARRILFGRIRRFVLHNHLWKAGFCRRYGVSPSRVDVVPLGVHDVSREWITQPVTADDRTVLFFGRQSAYKGLEVLYRAAPRVAELLPGVRFVVAGPCADGYRPPTPPELPGGGRIEVLNEYVPNSRAAALFQQATVVVCPYIEASQSSVVLTAYAFGKPVVATAVGGLPEYIQPGSTGVLVPPNDAQALATALLTVLIDADLRRQLTRGVNEFRDGLLSWENIARGMLAVYGAAARPGSPTATSA